MLPKIIFKTVCFAYLTLGAYVGTFAQQFEQNQVRPSFLSVHSGITVVYNTIDPEGLWGGGFRIFSEYQREFKNWVVGFAYEGMTPFSMAAFKPLTHFLCVNGYYKLRLYKNRVYLVSGVGIGAVHHYNNINELGLAVNGNLLLSIRLFEQIYLEIPPLIITPPSRIYYSPLGFKRNNNLLALPVFSFGVKMQL